MSIDAYSVQQPGFSLRKVTMVKFWDLVNRIELRQALLKWNDSGLSP